MSLAFNDDYLLLRRRRPIFLNHLYSVTEPATVIELDDPKGEPSPAAQWIKPVMTRVQQLLSFQRDWDGRGSAAVRTEAVSFAIHVLSSAMAPATRPPSIIPLGHGGVQLVWSNDDAELEIEVVAPLDVRVGLEDRRTGIERQFQAGSDFSEIATILKENFTG
jgi:hypothetical protein